MHIVKTTLLATVILTVTFTLASLIGMFITGVMAYATTI